MFRTLADLAELHEYIRQGNGCPNIARDCFANTWVLDETEDGDWQGVRPRLDEDEHGPGEDVWRPIGPTPIEHMNFPLTVAAVDRADAPNARLT